MITPSISFNDTDFPPLWAHLTVEEVRALIHIDVAELKLCLAAQEEDYRAAKLADRQIDYRFRVLIKAWERAQDIHWSWHKEILNARSNGTDRPEGLGSEAVGPGN